MLLAMHERWRWKPDRSGSHLTLDNNRTQLKSRVTERFMFRDVTLMSINLWTTFGNVDLAVSRWWGRRRVVNGILARGASGTEFFVFVFPFPLPLPLQLVRSRLNYLRIGQRSQTVVADQWGPSRIRWRPAVALWRYSSALHDFSSNNQCPSCFLQKCSILTNYVTLK